MGLELKFIRVKGVVHRNPQCKKRGGWRRPDCNSGGVVRLRRWRAVEAAVEGEPEVEKTANKAAW